MNQKFSLLQAKVFNKKPLAVDNIWDQLVVSKIMKLMGRALSNIPD